MFGVAEKRFVDNKEIKEKPGPGAYFYQEDLTEEGEGTNTNRDPTNGIFKSSTSRNCFGDEKSIFSSQHRGPNSFCIIRRQSIRLVEQS